MGLITTCLCPACFTKLYLGNCPIVSGRRTQYDPVTKRDQGVVLETPFWPIGAVNVPPLTGRKYTMEDARRQCTNKDCKYELPHNIERVPSMTLAIVGDTFSGKTHYIAGLIHQIKNEWQLMAARAGRSGRVDIECLTPNLETDYLRSFTTNLLPIQATSPMSQGTYPQPLIYSVVSSQYAQRPAAEFNLLIYDIAGEHFHEDQLIHFGEFVLNTNAFIYVADPFAIPAITSKLPSQLQNDLRNMIAQAQQRELADGLRKTISRLKRYRDMSHRARLRELPIAIMFSKSDLLRHVTVPLPVPHSFTFLQQPQYDMRLDLDDIKKVDGEVRWLLEICGQSALLNAASGFDQVKFLATSATGQPPEPGTQSEFRNVRPTRCLDPFLWMLYQLGVIESK